MSSCISHIQDKRQTSQRYCQSYTCFSIKPPEEEAERNFVFELKRQEIDFTSEQFNCVRLCELICFLFKRLLKDL